MVVGGTQRIIKYLLFFFNFVFVVTGLALIIVGAIVEYRARNYLNFIGSSYVSTAVLLIILGVVVFLIAFLGCCGASKENLCMIQTFSVMLFILFIMELAGGIAAYVYRDKLQDIAEKGLNNAFNKVLKNDTDAVRGWEDIQKEFTCCGLNGPNDFNDTVIPLKSCCKDQDASLDCTLANANPDGCENKMINYFKDNIAMVGGAGIGIAFVEIIGIVFACCLIRAIKAQYETV